MVWCKSREERKRSKLIDKEIIVARKQKANTMRLLLIGASNSGKTTIAKQIKSLHIGGLTEKELLEYKPIITNTVLTAINTLKQQANNQSVCGESITRTITDIPEGQGGVITRGTADAITSLRGDQALKQLVDHSTLYFFEHICRIAASDYVPTQQDVIALHKETKGVEETVIQVEGVTFCLLDTAEPRNMKKWIHCFEDLKGVVFCVDVGAYDTKRDDGTNTLHHSLQLFKELRDSIWLTRTDMILFLNKTDVFKDKIKRVPLTVCFPEYTGDQSFDASFYIRDRFLQLWQAREDRRGSTYSHFTCANDTKNIEIVFNAVCNVAVHGQYPLPCAW